jgi:sugar phosphate isomerase/epimerase
MAGYNVAISSIGWERDQDEAVAKLLEKSEVKFVELAPTKLWPEIIQTNPNAVSDSEVTKVKELWQAHGIQPIAMQSMLFLRPDLTLFDSPEITKKTLQYLKDFVVLAGRLDIQKMVFGSPKNRRLSETMSASEAETIAGAFFYELGETARENKIVFCIEPNPTAYNCNFVTTAVEGASLVRRVASPGFKLHLDTAGMNLAGDDPVASIKDNTDILEHFHVSAPYLEVVADDIAVDHVTIARTLQAINYKKIISIEMKGAAQPVDNLVNIQRTLNKVKTAYDL